MNAKKLATIVAASFSIATAGAQGHNDVLRFNKSTYLGTARSQAMGSAFGALGADLTSQSINPAGIGAYRATEFGIGFGVAINSAETQSFFGDKAENDKVSVPFSCIGFAFNVSAPKEKTSGVLGGTFSVSYSKLADYNRNASYEDLYGFNSMLDYFCADFNYEDKFTEQLAWNAGWLIAKNDTLNFETNVWEMPFVENGETKLDLAARADKDGVGLIDKKVSVKERGDKGEFSISYGMNISNIINWGASIGIQRLDYRETMVHKEKFYGTPIYDGVYDDFTYSTRLKQEGSGVNFKLGVIATPVSYLRVGFALHSPSFYSITERYSASIDDADRNETHYSDEDEYEYKYRTPGKFVASLAGIIGPHAIISFDYEHQNYKKSKFRDADEGYDEDYYNEVTDNMKDAFKTSHIFRVGLEGRMLECLYLRAGLNVQASPLNDGILNNKFINRAISGGIGFRTNNFFVDMSYVNHKQQEDRWMLPAADDVYIYDPDADNMPSKLTATNNNIILTLGFRF
ncbi:MAG: hypothetical protein MJZ01_06085 [Bacteroidales bacterium]|nr:hypothetical protein [Bacteroidales bacterium]